MCTVLYRILGGSWVVISGVISKATIVITQIRGLITILVTAHEPPSTVEHSVVCDSELGVSIA